MRFVSPVSGFAALGIFAWGCAVYDSGLASSGELMTGGDSGASTSGGGAQPTSMAGTPATGGTFSEAGNATTAGTFGMTGDGGAGADGGENAAGGSTPMGGAAGTSGAATGGSAGTAGGGGSAGNGGTGGSAPVVMCSDHPLTPKTMWVATASIYSPGNGMESDQLFNPPEHMTDGNYSKRWSTGNPQDGLQWIRIDFGAVVNLTLFTMDSSTSADDYPRHYEVRVTTKADPMFMAPVLVSADGKPSVNMVGFNGIVTGRYLTVRATAVYPDRWWSIAEVTASCDDP